MPSELMIIFCTYFNWRHKSILALFRMAALTVEYMEISRMYVRQTRTIVAGFISYEKRDVIIYYTLSVTSIFNYGRKGGTYVVLSAD